MRAVDWAGYFTTTLALLTVSWCNGLRIDWLFSYLQLAVRILANYYVNMQSNVRLNAFARLVLPIANITPASPYRNLAHIQRSNRNIVFPTDLRRGNWYNLDRSRPHGRRMRLPLDILACRNPQVWLRYVNLVRICRTYSLSQHIMVRIPCCPCCRSDGLVFFNDRSKAPFLKNFKRLVVWGRDFIGHLQ